MKANIHTHTHTHTHTQHTTVLKQTFTVNKLTVTGNKDSKN